MEDTRESHLRKVAKVRWILRLPKTKRIESSRSMIWFLASEQRGWKMRYNERWIFVVTNHNFARRWQANFPRISRRFLLHVDIFRDFCSAKHGGKWEKERERDCNHGGSRKLGDMPWIISLFVCIMYFNLCWTIKKKWYDTWCNLFIYLWKKKSPKKTSGDVWKFPL